METLNYLSPGTPVTCIVELRTLNGIVQSISFNSQIDDREDNYCGKYPIVINSSVSYLICFNLNNRPRTYTKVPSNSIFESEDEAKEVLAALIAEKEAQELKEKRTQYERLKNELGL